MGNNPTFQFVRSHYSPDSAVFPPLPFGSARIEGTRMLLFIPILNTCYTYQILTRTPRLSPSCRHYLWRIELEQGSYCPFLQKQLSVSSTLHSVTVILIWYAHHSDVRNQFWLSCGTFSYHYLVTSYFAATVLFVNAWYCHLRWFHLCHVSDTLKFRMMNVSNEIIPTTQ